MWIILNLYSNLIFFYFWNVIICLVDPNPPKLRLKWKRYVEYTRKKRRRRKLKLKLKFSKDQSYGRKQSHAPSEIHVSLPDELRVNHSAKKARGIEEGRGKSRPSAYHRGQTSKSLNGKTNYRRRGVPRTVARQCTAGGLA